MSRSTRNFVRHFFEMLLAMAIGMLVLATVGEGALRLAGSSSSELQEAAPAVSLLLMATGMTVPMVAWMRHRGHDWRLSAEMSAAMFIPTLGAIALLALGLVTDYMTLMVIEHNVMLPAMLVAMLLRREEYSHGAHDHGTRDTGTKSRHVTA